MLRVTAHVIRVPHYKLQIQRGRHVITEASGSDVCSKQNSILLAHKGFVHCQTLHVFHFAVQC